MTPWVKRLILLNVVLFVVTLADRRLFYLLAFVPQAVLQRPWTLVTYMFLHAGFGHILFNMLGLFFFGPRLEARLGSRHFLLLYFVSGAVGAILSFLLAPGAAVVGASAAVFGVLYGFARYWPTELIYIWGVLPIQARWLVAGLAALSIYSGFVGAAGGIAHFAHLGGFLGGWLFLRWRDRRLRTRRVGPSTPTVTERLAAAARRDEERWRSIPLDGLHEINRAEVERLFRKIEEQGPASLTRDERAFLDRMSGA